MAERNKVLALKPAQIDFEPRTKSKGKSGTAKRFHIKRTVKEEERRVSQLIIGAIVFQVYSYFRFYFT